MRILVTGGAGFIGKNLCLALIKQHHKVIAVDNFSTSNRKTLKDLSSHPSFGFKEHDIVNPLPPTLTRKPLDQIYHLACPTGVPNLTRLAEEMLLTCSIGTRNMLELARMKKAKLLFTSSSEIYGNPTMSPQKETYTGNVDPLGIRSSYEEGKRFAESLISMYVRIHNLDAKIVRIFNTYGPGMSDTDSRVIPRFFYQSRSGKPITVHGKGTQKRTFCYVDDLVRGLLLVMRKGKPGEAYNLGSHEQITIRQLARVIRALTKSASSITSTDRPEHDHDYRLPSLGKVKKIGWYPTISLRRGIALTLRKYTAP